MEMADNHIRDTHPNPFLPGNQLASKFSPMLTERFLAAIRKGSPTILACKYAGISGNTFYGWMKKAMQGTEPYATFAQQLALAEGEAVQHHLTNIDNAASNGAWQASAWLLERRYPDHYARRSRVEHTGVDGGAIQVEHREYAKLSDEEIDYLLAQRNQQDAVEMDASEVRALPQAPDVQAP